MFLFIFWFFDNFSIFEKSFLFVFLLQTYLNFFLKRLAAILREVHEKSNKKWLSELLIKN